MAWLVAGLGNPGDRYARTRHNLGKMVVEELARSEGVRLKKVRFLPAELAELRDAFAFGLLFLVLVIRPRGLLGHRAVERA